MLVALPVAVDAGIWLAAAVGINLAIVLMSPAFLPASGAVEVTASAGLYCVRVNSARQARRK